MSELLAFEDPNHPGNGPEHLSGLPCIQPGCDKPAGTQWGPHYCFEHNVQRIKRVDKQFAEALARMAAKQ